MPGGIPILFENMLRPTTLILQHMPQLPEGFHCEHLERDDRIAERHHAPREFFRMGCNVTNGRLQRHGLRAC